MSLEVDRQELCAKQKVKRPDLILADGSVKTVEDWSVTYFSNDYQRVRCVLAANIAEVA